MTRSYNNSATKINQFDIRNHVEFNDKGRALCPACSPNHKKQSRTLSLVPNGNGAYKCFRGCTPQEIRQALGNPKPEVVPTNLAPDKEVKIKEDGIFEGQKVADLHNELLARKVNSQLARNWLIERGITLDMMRHYKLGISRVKSSKKMVYAVSIPIQSKLTDYYYIKKRVAPWDKEVCEHEDYEAWKQWGVPATTYFTYLPEKATQTWLCEGEWDAILLGWFVQQHRQDVAVASFTCGCDTVPNQQELDRLPGEVYIFYDRNDKLTKYGDKPGETGAKKVAKALGDRGKIAQVPMPENCTVKGWDISDAIRHGYQLENFEQAVCEAQPYREQDHNTFCQESKDLINLYQTAPDYVDWLVPGLFTSNELYCLAAAPRVGKSLLALALAKAIASGGEFLGRPCQQGDVVYVCKEDPDDKVKERLIAQDWKYEEMKRVLINNKFTLDDLPDLIEYVKFAKPSLIIFDTLTRIQRNNARENSAEMTEVLAPLQNLAQTYNVCVLVIHHTKKNNYDSTSIEDIFDTVRGSGAIRGTCRGMLVLTRSKEGTRLAVETGRTDPADLALFLDKTTLTWKLKGKWNPPNVNSSQKEIVLDWFAKHHKGSIDQIHQGTSIHKRCLYEVLTRLIADKEINRTGRYRDTIYYKAQIQQVQQIDFQENCQNGDEAMDRGTNSTIREKMPIRRSGDHNCNGLLNPDPLITDQEKKEDFVEFGDQNDESTITISDLEVPQSSTNNSKVELVGKKEINAIKGGLITSDQNHHTTNFFDDQESKESKKEEKKEKETLQGVWHKEHGYLTINSKYKGKYRGRRSGERKEIEFSLKNCDDRREYETYCTFRKYKDYRAN